MKLHNTNLTIHIGDKVGFFTNTDEGDNIRIKGIVKGKTQDKCLTVIVDVNQFLTCTIPAKSIDSVNKLFISLNNFRDNLKISVGV